MLKSRSIIFLPIEETLGFFAGRKKTFLVFCIIEKARYFLVLYNLDFFLLVVTAKKSFFLVYHISSPY